LNQQSFGGAVARALSRHCGLLFQRKLDRPRTAHADRHALLSQLGPLDQKLRQRGYDQRFKRLPNLKTA
jgi:hypothetical protein